jgi:uncharacterized protein DUF5681
VNLQRKQPTAGSWQPGESGNAKGRPLGSRQRLSEQLLADIAETWAEHGQAVLTRLVAEDPAKFASLAFAILPRDVLVKVETAPPGNLEPDQWARLRDILALVERIAPPGTSPDAVMAAIEHGLRSELATPVFNLQHAPAGPAEPALMPPCPVPLPPC